MTGTIELVDNEPNTEAKLCRTLWLGVVFQAICDACVNDSNVLGLGTTKFDQMAARQWFDLQNADFVIACHLAGIDPIATLEEAKRQIVAADQAKASGLTKQRRRPFQRKSRLNTPMEACAQS